MKIIIMKGVLLLRSKTGLKQSIWLCNDKTNAESLD